MWMYGGREYKMDKHLGRFSFCLALCFMAAMLSSVSGDAKTDLITYLPGLLKQPSFNQYSGYLKGTGNNMLHYWFVESQTSPTKDPMIVWLSGGPGCSSMYAMLAENGPFTIRTDGVNLDYNTHSWNMFANVLYIESPAGVGFSYSSDGQIETDDDKVTQDHLAALEQFFTFYPAFKAIPLYLIGEGYGGVYAPLLARQIQNGSAITSLKGIAVGNARTSDSQLANSLMYFAYYRGIIGEDLWSTLQTTCCSGDSCDFYNPTSKQCEDAVNKALTNVDSIGINPYNILADCAGGSQPPEGALHKDGFYHYSTSPTDLFGHSQYMQYKKQFLHKHSASKLKLDLTCVNTSLVTTYLNNPYVREALHIDPSRPAWQVCNSDVNEKYTQMYPDMTATYIALQESYSYYMLVYNGDLDAMCNCLGDEWFVDALGLEEEVQWRSWLYTDSSLQIAGFVKEYDHVAFATVKGAGHMASADKPIATAQLISNFVLRRPF
ncbi:lysosomal protective protein-like [Diadema antillarum]|uniref:lysosomal protective protein-like n=1 Tax=Diadema antillarum TaxID=105358 RepID=UPI003A8A24D9